MTPYYDKDGITIYCGDSRSVVPEVGIVDAVCTDPPYGIGFMNRGWDRLVPPVQLWKVVLDAIKPGGHLVSFAGTRTHHRMAVNIEDAGFEIREMLAWCFGSGFPKSMNVSAAIDKASGAEREGTGELVRSGCRAARGGKELVGGDVIEEAKWKEITAPSTEAAKQWDGYGTALKPSFEPITLARKPLIGTVVQNVLEHGTGALNIDGCRIALNGDYKCKADGRPSQTKLPDNYDPLKANLPDTIGRWPATLTHDGSSEVLAVFPEESGAAAPVHRRNGDKFRNTYSEFSGNIDEGGSTFHGDSGSAARFFYCAKASSHDRGPGNNHPTVKPVALMRWIVRLITCESSIVLDPFMGSGTTLVAAKLEGRRAIGIELDEAYCKIAVDRLKEVPRTLF